MLEEDDTDAFEQLLTGKRWVCVLCKVIGLSVEHSLTQCAVVNVSNANKHLSKHTDRIAELDREQAARLKGTKRKAKSYKSITLETSEFVPRLMALTK